MKSCVRSPVGVSIHGHVLNFSVLSRICGPCCFVSCTEVANLLCCDSSKRRYISLNYRASHHRVSL